ncbi:hypothetical protein DQW77_08800 [Roseovarius sp. TE539]|uniref:hypothetical protein n=1 Tax=Roseovarius sp. TE539 TaxID=2249812 RepID=UPI000DDCC4E7|nr:hypothetical protein [Roseovarius sp. TE539]RBI73491.1 hypothetical protein DQW77_08800 [Roseovarius sp. TE539]
MTGPREDFRAFYLAKVGLGEGCGCAERVIDIFEADRLAQTPLSYPAQGPDSLRRRWRRFLNAAGLTRRRRRRS